jgi:hypothetical protein
MNNRLLLTWAAALTLVAAVLAGALAARGDTYAELSDESVQGVPLFAGTEVLGSGPEGMDLPVTDLKKPKGGVWNTGRIDWKKSDVVDFQGEPAIKVFYGKGSGTSRHKGVGGLNFSSAPPGLPGTSAMMSFRVYFAPGWHFSNGGKLTGFHIGEGNASGGRHSPNASSCRISFKEGGGAWMYVYPPSNLKQDDPAVSRTTGTGIGMYREKFPPGTFKIGEWNDVKIAVKLNTIDAAGKPAADGMSYVQINDKSATLTGMRWRRSADLLIEHYNFATFFGGGDPSVKDVTAYYRNFRLGPWNV